MKDEYTREYGKYSELSARRYSYKKRLDLIKNILRKKKCKNLLDVGSATGDYAIDLKKDGFDVTCVDINPNHLSVLKEKDKNLQVVGVNVLSLPFEDEFFDAIIILNAFRYFDNPSMSLKECNRVLKDEGHLILIDHNKFCPDTFLVKQNDVVKYFSLRELKDLLYKNSFKVFHEDSLFIPPPFTPKFMLNLNLNILAKFGWILKGIYPEFIIHAIKNMR